MHGLSVRWSDARPLSGEEMAAIQQRREREIGDTHDFSDNSIDKSLEGLCCHIEGVGRQ